MSAFNPLVIVTGQPRSGTSLMMHIVVAAGIPASSQGSRPADDRNPYGYCEDERVLALRNDSSFLRQLTGSSIKILFPLLDALPQDIPAKVIVMLRDENMIARSQIAFQRETVNLEKIAAASARIRRDSLMALDSLSARPNTAVFEVEYDRLVDLPEIVLPDVAQFIGRPEAVGAMAACIDRDCRHFV